MSGLPTQQASSYVLIPDPTSTDPNWQTSYQAKGESSILTERSNNRFALLVGFIENKRGVEKEKYLQDVLEVSVDTITFRFSRFQITNCNAISVERIHITGLDPLDGDNRRLFPADQNLCADTISNDLARNRKFFAFSKFGGGILKVKVLATDVVHEIEVFSRFEDDLYTMEELLERLVQRLTAWFVSTFPAHASEIQVDISVNSRGFLELFWGFPGMSASSSGLAKGVTIDWRCPFMRLFLKVFSVKKYHAQRANVSFGVVDENDGQSIELLVKKVLEERTNLLSDAPLIMFSSQELTQFQMDDSVTQLGESNIIASALALSSGDGGIKFDFQASGGNSNLISSKVPFDSNFTLESFTIDTIISLDNQELSGNLDYFYTLSDEIVKEKVMMLIYLRLE